MTEGTPRLALCRPAAARAFVSITNPIALVAKLLPEVAALSCIAISRISGHVDTIAEEGSLPSSVAGDTTARISTLVTVAGQLFLKC
jgi:hypothetical protein